MCQLLFHGHMVPVVLFTLVVGDYICTIFTQRSTVKSTMTRGDAG